MKVSDAWFLPFNNRHEIMHQVFYPTGRVTNVLGYPPDKKDYGKVTVVFRIKWKV